MADDKQWMLSLAAFALKEGLAFLSRPDPLTDYDLPAAFHFSVQIGSASSKQDCAFQEVSGFTQEMELEKVVCGGENRFAYQLPTGMKPGQLLLKRGIAPRASMLVNWCRSVLEGGLAVPIQTRDIEVRLLDLRGSPIRSWGITGAFPVKWSVDSFNSTSNNLAIETIEMTYLYCHRKL